MNECVTFPDLIVSGILFSLIGFIIGWKFKESLR